MQLNWTTTGLWHFADNAVSSEKAESSGYPSRGESSFIGFREDLGEKISEKIAIAKSVNRELSPIYSLQHKMIFF